MVKILRLLLPIEWSTFISFPTICLINRFHKFYNWQLFKVPVISYPYMLTTYFIKIVILDWGSMYCFSSWALVGNLLRLASNVQCCWAAGAYLWRRENDWHRRHADLREIQSGLRRELAADPTILEGRGELRRQASSLVWSCVMRISHYSQFNFNKLSINFKNQLNSKKPV